MRAVAVFGLGTMGSGMARQLVAHGFEVTAWNRSSNDRTAAVAAAGARLAATPGEAAANADVVISMVADDAASRSVWLGSDGALRAVRPGTVLIESSTLSPAWIAELADRAKSQGVRLIDAPVTGSRAQAESGQLLFLTGGPAETIDSVRDVLLAMGRDVVHLGPTGAGAFVKLVNNFLCGVQVAALAEAVAMVEASGLDREKALGILLNGAPGSPLVKAVATRMTEADYDVHFSVDLMAKDLAYASDVAGRHGVSLHTAAAALRSFQAASAGGLGNRDISAVVEPLRATLTA